MNPYDVLGLPYPSSKEEIKARYHVLARKHHPDKLQHLSKEERDLHEQEFKKINVAYELLTKKEFEYNSKTDWDGVWSSIHTFMGNPDLMQNMSELLKNVFQTAREYKKQKATEHHITLDVSLEEVHTRKEKKLRLFLHNIPDPVFLTADCGCYPFFLHTYVSPEGRTSFIHITFRLKPHPIYTLDTMFDTNDLYMTQEISLYEYMTGCKKELPYLDGTMIPLEIEPCYQGQIDIVGKGLSGKGQLTIYFKVILPSKQQVQAMKEKKREKLHRYLRELL